MAKILISYRRSDTAWTAGRLFDQLAAHYGADSVFMDIDNIPLGTDFREYIKAALLQSDVIIVLIGPNWVGPRSSERPRIDDPNDPVRIEVETALHSAVPIIPVLVDGTSMPSPDQLPGSLRDLAFRNAAKIEAGRDFRQQVGRVIRAVDHLLENSRATKGIPTSASEMVSPSISEARSGFQHSSENVQSTKIDKPASVSVYDLSTKTRWPALELFRKKQKNAIVSALLVLGFIAPIIWYFVGYSEYKLFPQITAVEQPRLPAVPVDSGSPKAATSTPAASPPPQVAPKKAAPTTDIGTADPAPPKVSPAGIPTQIEPITIAVAGPMTGFVATFGRQMRDGAELAVSDINAAGGVLGKKLKLEVGDDACDPKQARSVGEKFAGMKVPFVAGHYCSSSSIPASEAYAEGNVLQITPASTNPTFTERGLWNTFRVCGRDDQQGAVAGAYIAKNYKGANVAIIHDKTVYGKGLADETKKALNTAGVKEKLYEAYNKGDRNFAALVSKIKLNNIDIVYVGGYHTEVALIVRQMRDEGLKTVLMAGDALADIQFGSITGPAGEGVLFTFGPDPRKKPTAAAVVRRFRDKDIDPQGYTLYAYAAFQVWSQAVGKAATIDARKIAATLRAGTWDTVLGKIAYDRKGDITNTDYIVYKWDKNGNYAEMSSGL
jgi:branched-chain amino acid transport system substrate-binding protein